MNNTINTALDNALIHRKRKRIAAAVLVPILLLSAVLVAFWTSRDALAAPSSTNPQDYKVTVVYIDVGWDWPYFVANNQVAYCADNDKYSPMPNAVPQSVSFDYSIAHDPQMLVKVLFYGYGGPGSSEFPTLNPSVTPTTTAMKNLYATTTYNLHRSIHNSYYVSSPSPTAQWNQIAALPYPDFELAFTPANPVSTVVTLPGDVQIKRSEAITLTGGPAGNSVKIPLAPGGNYSIRKGSTLYPPGSIVEIFVGESFYVEAPAGHSGTFNPGTLIGEKASKFTVIILQYAEPNRQRVITWTWDRQEIGLEVEFTSTPAELQLAASKTVSAGAPTPWAFDFGVYASDSSGTQGAPQSAIKTATDSAPGILFDAIQIPEAGVYYYLVKETSAGGSGWTADAAQYLIEATVADSAGTLTVTQTRVALRANDSSAFGAWSAYTGTEMTFHNTYAAAPVTTQLKAAKTVGGTGVPTAWGFRFELYASDDSGAQGFRRGTAKIATNSMPAAAFDPIGLTEAGTHYFLIRETSANGGGWTMDTTQHLIEVTVADIAGTLTVTQRRIASRNDSSGAFGTWEPYSDTAAAFNNTYAADPVSVALKAAKTAAGGMMEAGQFSFTLSSTNSDATSTPSLLQTKTNAAAGSSSAVLFDALDYSEAGIFFYLLRETPAGDAGWTTDATQYHIQVHVTDTGGALTAEVSTRHRAGNAGAWSAWAAGYDADISSGWPAFNNSFSGFALKALKTAVGKEMEAGEFTFALYRLNLGSGENELLQQKNNLLGGLSSEVQFDTIPIAEPGTTYYMLAESSPGGGWAANSQLYLFRAIASGSPLTITLSYQAGPINLDNISGDWIAYTDEAPSTWPAFTNYHYGVVFPETGGTGTAIFTITAIALTALLFLFLARALIYNIRKRKNL